jgi:hypothetical protein
MSSPVGFHARCTFVSQQMRVFLIDTFGSLAAACVSAAQLRQALAMVCHMVVYIKFKAGQACEEHACIAASSQDFVHLQYVQESR